MFSELNDYPRKHISVALKIVNEYFNRSKIEDLRAKIFLGIARATTENLTIRMYTMLEIHYDFEKEWTLIQYPFIAIF